MMSSFLVTLYDKAFRRTGYVGDYEQLTVTPRHLATGTASMTVAGDHPRLGAILADGARVTIDYDVVPGDITSRIRLLSGPLDSEQGPIPSVGASVTVSITGDEGFLDEVLAWPAPGSALSAQSVQAYDVRTGPAESVIKAYVTANAINRLGLPLSVAPTPGIPRGATVRGQARMDTLRDVLYPLAAAGGVGITVLQAGAGLVLDCYTPVVRPQVLTERSGVVVGGGWIRTRPRATRGIVGGQGEGTARVFRQVVDTGREAAYGQRIEVFRDATDLTATADLDARAARVIAEGSPGAGVSIQLAENDAFRYGKTVRVGDVVTVELANGLQVAQVVGSCVLTDSPTNGTTVSPRLGDDQATAEPNIVLARALARVAATVRKLTTRR